MLNTYQSLRPIHFLHFVLTIKQYFPFDLKRKKFYRMNAVLARYKFNLGAPTLIVGFEMFIKQHINLDGFYFQRFFKHKMYSRFGTITYTKHLLVESFIPSIFINIFSASNNNSTIYNFNYFNYFEYFTISNTELRFKRLLNLDYEISDGATDLLFLQNRSFLGIRFSGFYVDYVISTYYATCISFVKQIDKLHLHVLNFAPNHIVMNVAFDYNYSFFISNYDKTKAYTVDNFFKILWHLELLNITKFFYLDSIYKRNFFFGYYLNLILHVQNHYNLELVAKLKFNTILIFLSKFLSLFPKAWGKKVTFFSKEIYNNLKSFFYYKYIYVYFIFYSIKYKNLKTTTISSLSWLLIFFNKGLKNFFITNFFFKYKDNFVFSYASLFTKYLTCFIKNNFFFFENFNLKRYRSTFFKYSNKIFMRFLNFNLKRNLSRLSKVYFYKSNFKGDKLFESDRVKLTRKLAFNNSYFSFDNWFIPYDTWWSTHSRYVVALFVDNYRILLKDFFYVFFKSLSFNILLSNSWDYFLFFYIFIIKKYMLVMHHSAIMKFIHIRKKIKRFLKKT